MNPLATALTTLALLTAALAGTVAGVSDTPTAPEPVEPIGFGMDAGSITHQTNAGVKPDYGTFWVGPWTLKHGWGGADNHMDSMRSQGVTPAIHFYYWGDDISQDCIENGCWSSLHGAQKDKAGWQQLADELVVHLNSQMQGDDVVIFVETEFNKADVQEYEPLDGYLAEKAQQIKAGYPNAQIVLSLGSWNTPAWDTWDRAAAASDSIGLQGMRGSTRDSATHYDNLYRDTLRNSQHAQSLFGQPIFLQDLALSTYPEPEYLQKQADGMQRFFDGMADLKTAGVEAMVYRSWRDTKMDLNNYYGEAERHWGFAYGDGTYKPSAQVWIDGVHAERGGAAEPGPAPEFTASFEPSPNSNEWWVEVRVSASSMPANVAASHNGGAWQTLPATSWGSYAKSFYAAAGGTMQFRATDSHSQSVTSEGYPWLTSDEPEQANGEPVASFTDQADGLSVALDASGSSDPDGDALSYAWELGDGATATGALVDHTYAASGTYAVQLTVSDGQAQGQTSRDVRVERPNTAPVASFEASLDGRQLAVDGSGSSDADGDPLSHTWDFGDGASASGATAGHQYAASGDYTVTLTVSDGEANSQATKSVTVEPPAFTASFKPASGSNTWWVEVYVDASSTPAKVEASHDGGAWKALPATDWGSYAKSFHAPAGGTMVFRATDASGQQATSQAFAWLSTDAEPEPAPEPEPEPAPAFTADFKPASGSNTWWVEVYVDASSTPAKVEASHDGSAWKTLDKTSWGSYAKSFHAPSGTMAFRATDAHGQTAQTEVAWLGSSGLEAQFTPKTQDNRWWVEVDVTSDEAIAKVEMRKDGGAWILLEKKSWGSYAKSIDVGTDAKIEFRATSESGAQAASPVYRWN